MGKDCCSPSHKQNGNKKSIDYFMVGTIAVTLLLLVGVIYVASKTNNSVKVEFSEQAQVSTDLQKYDWGTININGGVVSKVFKIENKGTVPLDLYNVKTSCMCTTAQLKINEKISKKYGMHEKTGNMFEVNPGETAELIVEFDPLYHGPSGVGAISRVITVNTNDSNNPELLFKVTATVVKNNEL